MNVAINEMNICAATIGAIRSGTVARTSWR